jgi:hypothetical protein
MFGMFKVEELRMLMAEDPALAEVIAAIAWGNPASQVIFDLTDALSRRGLVHGPELFDALERARPRLSHDIAALRALAGE